MTTIAAPPPLVLALPWYDDELAPPPPPPSPEVALGIAKRGHPHGRRPASAAPKHTSARLAKKEQAKFIPMASRAIQRKVLKESLATCSAALKKQVIGRKLLGCKNPLGALDLGRLAKVAGLSCKDCKAVAMAATTPSSVR